MNDILNEQKVCPFGLIGRSNGEIFENSMHCGEDSCMWYHPGTRSCVVYVLAVVLLPGGPQAEIEREKKLEKEPIIK